MLGLKHYFTGKPCKNGHLSNRFSTKRTCLACHAEKFLVYYNKNKSKVSATNKKSYLKHREARLVYAKEFGFKKRLLNNIVLKHQEIERLFQKASSEGLSQKEKDLLQYLISDGKVNKCITLPGKV